MTPKRQEASSSELARGAENHAMASQETMHFTSNLFAAQLWDRQ
jgi:hypothetical protein